VEREKEKIPRVSEQEDPILIALRHRWVELPSGIFVPEKEKPRICTN